MPLTAERIDRIKQALPGTGTWYDVYSRITEAVPKGEEEQHRSLVWAFGYDLITPGHVERLEREGSAFGAMWEFDGKRLPPRLADVPDEDVEGWAETFDAIDDPRLRSRVGDLLWERKQQPRPDQKARAACAALLELAIDPEWEPMESTHGLVRSLELADSLSDHSLREQVVQAIVKAIEGELESEHDRPGIPFSLLRPLVELPASARPSGLEDLISRAEAKYGADPHYVETAVDLKARIVAPEDVPELRRRQVRKWRDAAAKAEGPVRVAFLERGLDAARTHGLAEEAKQLRVELGSITEDELNLKKISAETKLDSELVEDYISSFVRFEKWEDGLTRFGIQGPPGGEPEQLDSQVVKQMQESPIQFLVTKIVIDPDSGAAIFRATDELTHKKAATAQQRVFAARIWSVFAVDVLRRIEQKYGRPDHEQLTEYFTAAFIDEAIAERISRAFELWWEGHPDEAAHILAPRIEAIIRELARQMGLPVIREPLADKPGGVRSLGDLLFALEGRLPTAGWHAYLFSLLSDPLGLNLRNVIGHGMRFGISTEDAALLLHAACFLRLVAPRQVEPGAETSGQ
jgi:hypothetical protein